MKMFYDMNWALQTLTMHYDQYSTPMPTELFFHIATATPFLRGDPTLGASLLLFLQDLNFIQMVENQFKPTPLGYEFVDLAEFRCYELTEEQVQWLSVHYIQQNSAHFRELFSMFKREESDFVVHRIQVPINFQSSIDQLLYFGVLKEENARLSVHPSYDWLVSLLFSNLTDEAIQLDLDQKKEIGDHHEKVAFVYEKNRLKMLGLAKQANMVRMVGKKHANIGFDLLSFSTMTFLYNRFIEVKSLSELERFFWSANEYEKAKVLKERYFLYLVRNDTVIEIQNPAERLEELGLVLTPVNYEVDFSLEALIRN